MKSIARFILIFAFLLQNVGGGLTANAAGISPTQTTPVPTQAVTATLQPTVTTVLPTDTSLPAETGTVSPSDTITPPAYPPPGTQTPIITEPSITASPSAIPEDTVTPGLIVNTPTPAATGTATTLTSTQDTPTPGETETGTPVPTEDGVSIVPASGGTVTGLNGRLRLIIPDQALSEAIQVSIHPPAADAMPPYSLSGHPFEIDALGQTSLASVNHFAKPVTLELDYSQENLIGDPSGLQLFYYDETNQGWMPLSSWADTAHQVLYAQTDHLTLFDFDTDNWQAAQLPRMDEAQVSSYTGSGSYSIPIEVPEGPGGLKPSLSLDYNSQVVDGSTVQTQADWAGMGWSIDTGYVERNMYGTDDSTQDDTFNLVLNGTSSLLLEATDGTWYTADENFYRIQPHYVVPNDNSTIDTWTIWDKTGTLYVFGEKTGDRAMFTIQGQYSGGGCHEVGEPIWRWGLSRVTNIFGQSLTYTYAKETQDFVFACEISQLHHHVDLALYPESITYSNNQYRVWFVRDQNRSDYLSAWPDIHSRVLFEKSRLTEIDIQQNTNGDWSSPTLIRKYVLTYADTGPHIFPGNTVWANNGKTLTLISVQEYGLNGTNSLPATTFTYGDNLHLTEVDNGYGGSVKFTYQIWYETDAGDLSTWKDEPFCQYYNNGTWSSTNQWASTPPGKLYCGANTLKIHYGNEAYHDISIHYSQPGAEYMVQVVKGGGPDYKVGLKYTTGGTDASAYSAVGTYVMYFNLPADASAFSQGLANCTTQTQDCEITSYKIKMLVTRYRVIQKDIYDGVNPTPQTFTYHYDDAATNDAQHSAAAQLTPAAYNYVQALSDYRGNSSASEIGPDGKVTTNFYYQDDARRGQVNNTLVSTQSFYDAFDATNTTNWIYTPSSMADHTITRLTGDNALKTYNSAANWNVSLYRQNTALHDGNMVMVQFQVKENTAQSVLALESGSGANLRRWGIWVAVDSGKQYIYPQYTNATGQWNYGPVLVSTDDFKTGSWYVLMLIVDGANSYLAVWQRDNPDIGGSYSQSFTPGQSWQFKQWTWNGTVYLDEFSEGSLYTWNRTFYQVCTPSAGTNSDPDCPSAITLATISQPLGNYNGFAVYWVRTAKTQSMDFEGHGSFMGSQVEYRYEKAYQGGVQYGSQTRMIESQWSGSAFTGYRNSEQQYYPYSSSGVYLVGLPGYLNVYQCPTTCPNSDNSNLLSSTWYLYDSHISFSQQPTNGILTGKRVMTRWAGPGITNPMYSDEVYTYDAGGNQATVTRYSGEGTFTALATTGAQTTTTCYGGTINPPNYNNGACINDGYDTYSSWQRDAAGNVTQWAYDPIQGVPIKEVDPNGISNQTGYTTTATYDGFGRLLTIRRPGDEDTNYKPTIGIAYFDSYPGSNNAPFMINIEAKINNGTTYDAFENVRKFYNGLGQLIQQQTAHINLNGDTAFSQDVIVDYQYDAYGRVVKQDAPWSTPKWYNGMPNRPTPYYPPNLPLANATLTTYDILGRAVSVTAPDSTVTTTAYSIDPTHGPGLKIDQKDARNNHTDTIQDAWGRTIQVIPPTGPGTTYTYYVTGNLWTVTRAGNTTTMTYDLASRKLTMVDPDMGSWSYAYDALGNLVRQKDAKLQNTCLYYDGDNRLTGKVYQVSDTCPTNPITLNVVYAYDQGTNGKGQRTSMTDSSGNTTWIYDARGRMVNEVKVIDIKSYTTSWTYNSADQVATMTYPTYTGGTRETVTTSYISQMAISSITAGSDQVVSNTTYDAAGRTITRFLLNNSTALQTKYTYYLWNSNGGRLNTIQSGPASAPTSLQNLTYNYDANGNITSTNDAKAGETINLTYDSLNRLDQVAGAYSDDPVYDASTGNLVSKNSTPMTYGTQSSSCPGGALSKPHAVVTAGSSNTYCYDLNGNMVQRKIGSTTYTLAYDAENRLTGVSGGASATFVYDGDGNRVKAIVGGITTYYVGNYFETDNTAANTKSYYYEGATLVAMRQWTDTRPITYLFTNNIGSITYAVDPNGTFKFEIRYYDWGDQRSSSGTISTTYQFTDQRKEVFNGGLDSLYYFQARWYDPYLGRFTQPDSIIPNPYNPQSYDRYAYVGNNPINRVDPSGHWDNCNFTDRQCVIDNAWTVDIFKNQINAEYGITMADSEGMKWSMDNIKTAYSSLNKIDDKLQGNLKNLVSGTTFTIMGGGVQYYGITDSTGVNFHVANSNTEIPEINFLHETGHLLDSVPATENVFSGPLEGSTPTWVKNGYVNSELLIDKSGQPVQAIPMGEKGMPREYWADAFANYVDDNILTGPLDFTGEGQLMYDYVFGALKPYVNP